MENKVQMPVKRVHEIPCIYTSTEREIHEVDGI